MYRILATMAAIVVAVGAALAWAPEASADTEVQLQPGLNEFVYTGETAPVAEALSSIDGLYSVVFHWDGPVQRWRTFRPPPALALLSDLTALEKEKIYWIGVEQSLRLTIAELPPPCVSPVDGPFMRS